MRWLKGFDRRIFDFTLKLSQENLTHKLMWFVSRSGDLGVIWFCVCIVLLFLPGNRRIIELCMITLLLTTIFSEGVLKKVIRRQRPHITHGLEALSIRMPTSFSFPSGHTASAVACARILAAIGLQAAIPAYGYALLMAVSRVYLKVHYVTDVIAGGVLGYACSEAVRWYFR